MRYREGLKYSESIIENFFINGFIAEDDKAHLQHDMCSKIQKCLYLIEKYKIMIVCELYIYLHNIRNRLDVLDGP